MGGKTVVALVQKSAMIGSSTEWGGEPENNPVVLWGSATLGLISKSRMRTVPGVLHWSRKD